ncbi:unnamed protein product [Protopolystoma xenopodis]|uniref:Uncharacterized protein n=1 Tax=Protopolystoma xenopodis TaxID=117903 RepID=A0A448XIB6_9PLAT|nr:unnamed protein product [Protopolystoma xenopodis]
MLPHPRTELLICFFVCLRLGFVIASPTISLYATFATDNIGMKIGLKATLCSFYTRRLAHECANIDSLSWEAALLTETRCGDVVCDAALSRPDNAIPERRMFYRPAKLLGKAASQLIRYWQASPYKPFSPRLLRVTLSHAFPPVSDRIDPPPHFTCMKAGLADLYLCLPVRSPGHPPHSLPLHQPT